MATKTPTPIAVLEREAIVFHANHHDQLTSFSLCTHVICIDARAALKDVKVLVVVLSKYPHQHDHRCYVDGRPKGVSTLPVCGVPEALAKFTVKP